MRRSAAAVAAPARAFRDSIAYTAYEQAGIGPEEVSVAEVYDLSTALELDWYENIGLCAAGDAQKLLRDGDTTIGGRVPVNPSGGLACFGEAVPAQAIAQVCELTWQLRGQAGARSGAGGPSNARISASTSRIRASDRRAYLRPRAHEAHAHGGPAHPEHVADLHRVEALDRQQQQATVVGVQRL